MTLIPLARKLFIKILKFIKNNHVNGRDSGKTDELDAIYLIRQLVELFDEVGLSIRQLHS